MQPKTILIYVSHPLPLPHFASHSTYYLFLSPSISLFSGSDSEVALAVKEQSIICLESFINIVYIAVLKQERIYVAQTEAFSSAIWMRYKITKTN